MAAAHYENFPVASLLLPTKFRDPVALIYRFARNADDFADEGSDPPPVRLGKLAAYRSQLETIARGIIPDDVLFQGLARIVHEHKLPLQPFEDLLDAFSQDVVKSRYADFSETLDYCRRSANPVGRLLLHLFGRATPENLAASDSICSALQLVNFWQDVEIDYARARIYLPQDEMKRYGVTEQHIIQRLCDDAWRSLIGFQVHRARAMLESGAPLGGRCPAASVSRSAQRYKEALRILEKLERAQGDMFRHRPVLKWPDWPIIFARAL